MERERQRTQQIAGDDRAGRPGAVRQVPRQRVRVPGRHRLRPWRAANLNQTGRPQSGDDSTHGGYVWSMAKANEQAPDPEDNELEVPGLPEDDDGDHPITEPGIPMPL
jgi:hypothetical protein